MKTWFLVSLTATSLFWMSHQDREPAPTFRPLDYNQELFFATLEGAYRDGLSTENAQRILAKQESNPAPQHFVAGCSICTPVQSALRVYAKRAELLWKGPDTFGPGISKTLAKQLESEALADRVAAINRLVGSWIERYVERLRLTRAERAAWDSEMEERRKEGMSFLMEERRRAQEQGQTIIDTCPSCDGANPSIKR